MAEGVQSEFTDAPTWIVDPIGKCQTHVEDDDMMLIVI